MEFCQVHGKDYYGTHRQVLRNIMEKGKVCILEIDVQGAQKILQQGLEANYVFINAKNSEVLRERLNKRCDLLCFYWDFMGFSLRFYGFP